VIEIPFKGGALYPGRGGKQEMVFFLPAAPELSFPVIPRLFRDLIGRGKRKGEMKGKKERGEMKEIYGRRC